MNLKQINTLLNPSSIAVIGASNKPDSVSYRVIHNLQIYGYLKPIMPVSQTEQAVLGILTYAQINKLPLIADLTIICEPDENIATVLTNIAETGCKMVIIMRSLQTASHLSEQIKVACRSIIEQYAIRILGPDSLGLIVPDNALNASLTDLPVSNGKVAFISQSAAICGSVLEWAQHRNTGFSHFISLGDSTDLESSDLIDALGRDYRCHAILLYIESIKNGRAFLSAARAVAKIKPIIVFKSGRFLSYSSAQFITSPPKLSLKNNGLTTNLTNNDTVYEAAFKRAGMLRVDSLQALFAAVETLTHGKPLKNEKLFIISNSHAPAQIALDTLFKHKGQLVTLTNQSNHTFAKALNIQSKEALNTQSFNPLLLSETAPAQTWQQMLKIALEAPEIENILLLYSPSGLNKAPLYAQAVVDYLSRINARLRPNIQACWLGDISTIPARTIFNQAQIPTYRTPENAINAFMQLVQYRRNQKQLSQTPESISQAIPENAAETAQQLINVYLGIREQGHQNKVTPNVKTLLQTENLNDLLKAYNINLISTVNANNINEAINAANAIGFPVALKIKSAELNYKSEIGGVVLNLNNTEEVKQAAQSILKRAEQHFPPIPVEGFTIQAMASRHHAHEIRISMQLDPVFGPVMLLGQGGQHWRAEEDAVVAIPPLNTALANYCIMQAFSEDKLRDRHLSSPINRPALALLLTKLSQMVIDNPQINGFDINPVLASDDSLTVIDMTMELTAQTNHQQQAILPYPSQLAEFVTLKNDRRILVRPIKAEDEASIKAFDKALNPEDRYRRYFGEGPVFTHEHLANLTQIDYDREMAFIAITDQNETLAVTRVQLEPDKTHAEFSIVVQSNQKGLGLAKILMQKMIDYCLSQQVKQLTAMTMLDNIAMIGLAQKFGFVIKRDFDEGCVTLTKQLN